MKTTLERVIAILARQLNLHAVSVNPVSKLVDDLGADSLDVCEIIMACEDEFGIDLPDPVTDDISTVGQMVEAIDKATAAA